MAAAVVRAEKELEAAIAIPDTLGKKELLVAQASVGVAEASAESVAVEAKAIMAEAKVQEAKLVEEEARLEELPEGSEERKRLEEVILQQERLVEETKVFAEMKEKEAEVAEQKSEVASEKSMAAALPEGPAKTIALKAVAEKTAAVEKELKEIEAATTKAERSREAAAVAVDEVVVQVGVEVVGGDAEAEFDALDKDKSGYLEGNELHELADWVWRSFHPDETITAEDRMSETAKLMKACDGSSDGRVDKEEFLPWYEHHSTAVNNFNKALAVKQAKNGPCKPELASKLSHAKAKLISAATKQAERKAFMAREEATALNADMVEESAQLVQAKVRVDAIQDPKQKEAATKQLEKKGETIAAKAAVAHMKTNLAAADASLVKAAQELDVAKESEESPQKEVGVAMAEMKVL